MATITNPSLGNPSFEVTLVGHFGKESQVVLETRTEKKTPGFFYGNYVTITTARTTLKQAGEARAITPPPRVQFDEGVTGLFFRLLEASPGGTERHVGGEFTVGTKGFDRNFPERGISHLQIRVKPRKEGETVVFTPSVATTTSEWAAHNAHAAAGLVHRAASRALEFGDAATAMVLDPLCNGAEAAASAVAARLRWPAASTPQQEQPS